MWRGVRPEQWRRSKFQQPCDECGKSVYGAGAGGCSPENVWQDLAQPKVNICGMCLKGDIREALFGRFSEEESLPPIGIMGIVRSGTTMMAELLETAGVWMGHQIEDPHAQELAKWVAITGGMMDDLTPHEVEYEQADAGVREMGPIFLATHRRPFPWGWKYYSHHWGMNGWLDLCPDGKFIMLWRNDPQWIASMLTIGTVSIATIRKIGEWNKASVRRFEGHPQVCLVHYDELLKHPKREMDRVATFLSPIVELPGDIHKEIRTERRDGTSRLCPVVGERSE